MSVTNLVHDSKISGHNIGCTAKSNPNSTVHIKVGTVDYLNTVCSAVGDCGQYECSSYVSDVQVIGRTDILCNVIYYSYIGEHVTIETYYSNAQAPVSIMTGNLVFS